MGIIDFTPDALSLLESNRNLGYSIAEAISDLIDNSITAGATKISYHLNWNDGKPFFLLVDNGCGMSNYEAEFTSSFKLGSIKERNNFKDLGRFGMGMKTASLSQARVLSVFTKKENYNTLGLSLDLNFINEMGNKWLLKELERDEFQNHFDYLDHIPSGTIIRWDDWDRAPNKIDEFVKQAININNYLAVCFHRFIENGISILYDDRPIQPCSPIPNGKAHVFSGPRKLKGNYHAKFTSYILQHPKFWDEDYENSRNFNSFKLFDGFEKQQGIYIYRCDRLLTPKGGWPELTKHTNSSKLARIVIDIPNTSDELWSLEITKTNATIPLDLKNEIRELIDATKKDSSLEIGRSNKELREELNIDSALIWLNNKNNQFMCYTYSINIEHPVFQSLIEDSKIKEKELKVLLNMISSSLPISLIIKNNEEEPTRHDRLNKSDKLSQGDLELAKKIFELKVRNNTKAEAITWLLQHEPFCYYIEQIKEYLL
jgi:hypothetical protein